MTTEVTIQIPIGSRYADTEVYSSNDDIYFGTWKRPDWDDDTDFTTYQLRNSDIGRFDILAEIFYGDRSLFWVLLDFNQIVDPFNDVYVGQKIKVLTLERLIFYGVV